MTQNQESETVTVQRTENGEQFWCRAKYKRTESYQDSIAVKCGGFVILPGGISKTHPVTCPDCLAGRRWTDKPEIE